VCARAVAATCGRTPTRRLARRSRRFRRHRGAQHAEQRRVRVVEHRHVVGRVAVFERSQRGTRVAVVHKRRDRVAVIQPLRVCACVIAHAQTTQQDRIL
jgi:hypothetical protein